MTHEERLALAIKFNKERQANKVAGQEIAMLKLSNIQKDNTINILGQELANIKLQLLQGGM